MSNNRRRKSFETSFETSFVSTDSDEDVPPTNNDVHILKASFNELTPFGRPLPKMPTTKRRVTSQDWVKSRSLSDISLPEDFSFNDDLNEDDPDTSALQSFSESQGSLFESFSTCSIQTESTRSYLLETHQTQAKESKFCTPTHLDVLLGRGGGTNSHAGNIRYREEVEKVKPMYSSCYTKPEKKQVSELLVAAVHDYGGRFLEKDLETELWVLAPQNSARKKASQALRETKWKKRTDRPPG